MDLIVFLFTSYLSVKDSEFVEYIKLKKLAYDEAAPGANALTPEHLMSLALSKYHQLKQANVWRQKSKAEETIIALTAKLKQAETLLSKQLKVPGKKETPTNDGNKDKGKNKREFSKVAASWKRECPSPMARAPSRKTAKLTTGVTIMVTTRCHTRQRTVS